MNEKEIVNENGPSEGKKPSKERRYLGPVVLSGEEFVEITRRFPEKKIEDFINERQKRK